MKKKGGRKKMKEGKEGGGRGKGGKKRRKNCIGRCFIEIRGEIYLDVSKSSSSSFQSFVFLYFFFFPPFAPEKYCLAPRGPRAECGQIYANS